MLKQVKKFYISTVVGKSSQVIKGNAKKRSQNLQVRSDNVEFLIFEGSCFQIGGQRTQNTTAQVIRQ